MKMRFIQLLLALLFYCAAEAQFPLPYNITQGDGAICPNEQTRLDISNRVQGLLKDRVIPLLPTSVPQCSCMSKGRRIAHLDMSDPNQQCPPGLRLIESPRRTCGRDSRGASCQSISYAVNGASYQNVCGRILAYQFCDTGAFNQGFYGSSHSNIDSYYVDGISITHGSPRQHVWTFASAFQQMETGRATCPCTNTGNADRIGTDHDPQNLIPSFVDNDYFCDSLARYPSQCGSVPFPTDDPLWDGAGCLETSTCCDFNNPPWFCKTLPQPTTDDIEVRICGDRGIDIDDTPVEIIELYVS